MVGRAKWPSMGQKSENIREHGTQLLVNTKAMLTSVKNKDTVPNETAEAMLQDVIEYLERAKEAKQTEIMQAIDHLAMQTTRNHEALNENTIAIRNTITDLSSSLSSPTSLKNGRQWSSLFTANTKTPVPKPEINKSHEVIVRLYDSGKKQEIQKTITQDIIKDINASLTATETTSTAIRAVKKLPSGDLAIHTINEEEATKLRHNSGWVRILGKQAKQVIQTYAVMIPGIETEKWNLNTQESRDSAMRAIKAQNENIEELQGMEILWIGWRQRLFKDQQFATMILEVSDPVMGNAMLDNSIVIGDVLRACSVFNKACRTLQCFKCYHYGHITVQCTREERCGHCAGRHSTQANACVSGVKPKCCLCGGPHKPWQRECPDKQKEIARIQYQISITPSRFASRGKVTHNRSYFDDATNITVPTDMEVQYSAPQCTNEIEAKRQKKSNTIRFGNTMTPNLSQDRPSRARSTSPTKGRGNKRLTDESEKGGDYSSSAPTRVPLGEVSNNRGTRSTTKE